MATVKHYSFKLPGNLAPEIFISILGDSFTIHTIAKTYMLKSFYDSFDWRLYANGLLCEFQRSKAASAILLGNNVTARTLVSCPMGDVPSFVTQWPDNTARQMLLPIIENRALLQLTTLDYTDYRLNVVDREEKTVARIDMQAYCTIPCRVTLTSIKGYDKSSDKLLEQFGKLGLCPTSKPVLLDALKILNRKPLDYSAKLHVELDPDMRADLAVKYIYSHLLKTLKLNEQGVIAAIDSEFLHDFRVAVRRTRCGLSQLKSVLPEEDSKRFNQFFRWLGQITGPARDLDVWVEQFDDIKYHLSPTQYADLAPLKTWLMAKQHNTQQGLAKHLQSAAYIKELNAWEEFLKTPIERKPRAPRGLDSVKRLANSRIRKLYQHVKGVTFNELSAAQEFHQLRKTCKKLRYLMEFFQSLYPDDQLKPLLKNVKRFQEILGRMQDLAIQKQTLLLVAGQWRMTSEYPQALIALETLVASIDSRQQQARLDFAAAFEEFSQAEYKTAFETLFGHSKRSV